MTGLVLIMAAPAFAQRAVPPFFGGGQAALFDPEISVVNSGVINDVQAVVSHDRKYVTLNMRPSSTALLALREFSFQQGGRALGFVGGAGGTLSVAASQSNSLLDRSGTTRVDRAVE